MNVNNIEKVIELNEGEYEKSLGKAKSSILILILI